MRVTVVQVQVSCDLCKQPCDESEVHVHSLVWDGSEYKLDVDARCEKVLPNVALCDLLEAAQPQKRKSPPKKVAAKKASSPPSKPRQYREADYAPFKVKDGYCCPLCAKKAPNLAALRSHVQVQHAPSKLPQLLYNAASNGKKVSV